MIPTRTLQRPKQLPPKLLPIGPLMLVLPFYSGDVWLLEKNIKWMRELDEKLAFDCLIAFDTQTDPGPIPELAKALFRSVDTFRYKRLPRNDWPIPQNHLFASLAWHMPKRRRPWLLLETDAVPIRAKWLSDIATCHAEGRKPFTGHWSETNHVFNGTGVYPPDVVRFSPKMMEATMIEDPKGKQSPWDVYGSKEIERHLNKANHLFQHCWNDDKTGMPYTFPTYDAVKAVVRKGVAVFHRCKDASLVMRLHEQNQKGYSKDFRWTI